MKWWRRTALTAILLFTLTFGAQAALPETLVAGGRVIGLKLQTQGVIVAELSENSAKRAGLHCGDLICAVNGQALSSAQELRQAVEQSEGAVLHLTVLREGQEKTVTLSAKQTAEGWRLGVAVREGVTGIGTVTYFDPQTGAFGALGHGVNDGATAALLPLESGLVLPANVTDVVRGREGKPGALCGTVTGRTVGGVIEKNTERGIFGTLQAVEGRVVPVAAASEVHTGAATILSNVSGDAVEEYDIVIRRLYSQEERDMLIEVTDASLLARTGGIVQGMSGSPILQDGKLVGAVTHVLVNDPTTGYGIFIENMLNAA